MNWRYLVLILLLVFSIETLLVVPEVWGPGRRFMAAVWPAVVIDYANVDRTSAQTAPLQVNAFLTKAAQLKAEDMARRSYFSHNGPTGEAPWFWFDQVGYKYVYAGENLALDFYDSNEVNQAWLASPKHRANIMDKNFTDIGVGLATGKFEGQDRVFIVQLFGSTEASLAKRDQLAKVPLGFKRANVLSAAIGLSDNVLSELRALSLSFFNYFGCLPIKNSQII